ncbi:MAG: hypothetical protein AB1758_18480 [Candidatus Eremiobacterota bacterium]
MEVPEGLDPEVKEAYQYLLEVLGDYERYTRDIGKLGLAAPNLLYYRDEVQEFLDILKAEGIEARDVWRKVVELDNLVRSKAQEIVDEVGHANFKQYQVINDPPPQHWWWFLNRTVAAPPESPPAWQVWKRF